VSLCTNKITKSGYPVGPDVLKKCEAAFRAGASVGADQRQQQLLHNLLWYSILGLAVVTLVVAVVGWLVAGRVLRPLHDITATARRLSAEHLDERINLGGPRDELRELADTFDAMLGRLDAAFSSQRRFVANAAHELRTPLTIMRTELDVTLDRSDAGPEELAAMARVLRQVTERTERLLDGLLLLATSEAGVPLTTPVDLADLAGGSVAAQRDAAWAAGLTVRTRLRPVRVTGHRELLGRLVDNLMDNAVRHNRPGGWIEVDVGPEGGQAVLRVASSGLEVPDEAVGAVFEPFRRVAERTGSDRGAGLGLSIVRSVATAHGGQAGAEAVPGGGLGVTVRLPAAGPGPDPEPAPGAIAEPEKPGGTAGTPATSSGRPVTVGDPGAGPPGPRGA
jgi:signal transduction histidine kinase